MSNLLAGVGRTQLQLLDHRVDVKRNIFNKYYQALSHLPGITFIPELENTRSNRWLTTLTINEEASGVTVEALLAALQKENIEARHVWKPLHLQPLFKGTLYYVHKQGEHIAENLFATGICLPSGSNLSEVEQQRVITCMKEVFNRSNKRNIITLKKYEVSDQ
jgi:pyridoxal phosphate-dependent aminotransferase EpsN